MAEFLIFGDSSVADSWDSWHATVHMGEEKKIGVPCYIPSSSYPKISYITVVGLSTLRFQGGFST